MLGVAHAGQPAGAPRDLRPGPARGAVGDPDLPADPPGPAPGDRRRRGRARRQDAARSRARRGHAARVVGAASGARRGSRGRDVRRARATADAGAVRAARRDPQRLRAGHVLDHLLPPLVPAGAVGRQVPEAGEEQPGPRGHRAGARAARSSTATGTSWSTTGPRSRCSSSRPSCHARTASASAEFAAPGAGGRACRPTAIRKQLHQQTKDLPANPVTLKRDVPYDLVYYLRENQAQLPRGQRPEGLRPQLPERHAGRADPRLRARGHRASSSRSPATRACSRATRSARRGSRTPTTTSCAGSTA